MAIKNIHKSRRTGNFPCEICGTFGIPLERHHLRGRDLEKWNKEWNIAYICCNCHSAIHLGDIIVEGRFHTSTGNRLLWHKEGEPSITGEVCECHLIEE